MKHMYVLVVWLAALMAANGEEISVAQKIAAIDAGKWRTPQAVNITRIQSMLDQLRARYGITELEVADNVVHACHKLMRDKYGIEQTLQTTLEHVNRVDAPAPRKGDFGKLMAVYAVLRNGGTSGDEAIARLNAALRLDPRVLDSLDAR